MEGSLYSHFSDYKGPWPWEHFAPAEVACKHCGELYVHKESMDALQRLRDAWGKPIRINSGHRCTVHNHAVGGKSKSFHLQIAFDCHCAKAEQQAFIKAARWAGFTCTRAYPTFVHMDMGPDRTW